MTITDWQSAREERVAALALIKSKLTRADGTRGRVGVRHVPVQCVQTGEWFDSMKAAATRFGGLSSNIHYAVKTGTRAYGFHWRRAGQTFKPYWRPRRYKVIEV